jgi:hypothetical protein
MRAYELLAEWLEYRLECEEILGTVVNEKDLYAAV